MFQPLFLSLTLLGGPPESVRWTDVSAPGFPGEESWTARLFYLPKEHTEEFAVLARNLFGDDARVGTLAGRIVVFAPRPVLDFLARIAKEVLEPTAGDPAARPPASAPPRKVDGPPLSEVLHAALSSGSVKTRRLFISRTRDIGPGSREIVRRIELEPADLDSIREFVATVKKAKRTVEVMKVSLSRVRESEADDPEAVATWRAELSFRDVEGFLPPDGGHEQHLDFLVAYDNFLRTLESAKVQYRLTHMDFRLRLRAHKSKDGQTSRLLPESSRAFLTSSDPNAALLVEKAFGSAASLFEARSAVGSSRGDPRIALELFPKAKALQEP